MKCQGAHVVTTCLVTATFIAVPGAIAQTPSPYPWHCDGFPDECPTRYTIEGFPVYVSPTVYTHPGFSYSALGREIDTLAAQLLWVTSFNSVPRSAVRQLIDSGVSFYLDSSYNWSEWWPCGREFNRAGCYHASANRIGLHVLSSYFPYPNQLGKPSILNNHVGANWALHELAHAFHAHVVTGGSQNVCIRSQYAESKSLYEWVEQREQVRFFETEVPLHERDPGDYFHFSASNATVNEYEFFAVLSEAMFATSGRQPYNRNDLWRMDRNSYMLIWNAWHDPSGFCPEQLQSGEEPRVHDAPEVMQESLDNTRSEVRETDRLPRSCHSDDCGGLRKTRGG